MDVPGGFQPWNPPEAAMKVENGGSCGLMVRESDS